MYSHYKDKRSWYCLILLMRIPMLLRRHLYIYEAPLGHQTQPWYWPIVTPHQVGCCHYSDVIVGTMASQITSPTIVYSIVYSGTNQRKTSKLRVTGLCEGNSPVTGEFPAQRASDAENVSIWWRHHAISRSQHQMDNRNFKTSSTKKWPNYCVVESMGHISGAYRLVAITVANI